MLEIQLNTTHFELISFVNSFRSPIIDFHSSLGQTMLFFHLAIHEEDGLGKFGRTFGDGFFKQISCPLDLVSAIPRDELGQVGIEQLKSNRVGEEF